MSIQGMSNISPPMGNIRSSATVSEEMRESPAERSSEAGKSTSSKMVQKSNLPPWQGSKVDLTA